MSREIELIDVLTRDLPLRDDSVVGPGDDCAVVAVGADVHQLLKTDAIVEGVHFDKQHPAAKIGRKALARPLSDIAAMGGKPHSALVTMGLPKDYDAQWILDFYDGLKQLAREFDVAIVGGETVCSPDRVFCSVALTGEVARDTAILRSRAQVGDALFVTGDLGGSIEGKHLDFVPRLKEAQWLVQHFDIHAMIDLSDGLSSDLHSLCRSSGVGAELWGDYLPISRVARLRAKQGDRAKPALVAALTDGEDFELLFCVAPVDAVKLKDSWREAFPEISVTCIGKLLEEPEVMLQEQHGKRPLGCHGYDHFQ
ncbi:MAG: thiamine-phosphate kinase [Verrucomicrobiota bacterium]|nr:thiamine-phosphate kinase [Verrucomicrobiota bacterium]